MGRILLFEQNRFIRNALIRIIQVRFPDVVIQPVSCRDECLAETKKFLPDVLILGARVYDGNRLDLLQQLRENHSGITIIVFIDYDIDEYRKDAMGRGADHVISREVWTGNEILSLVQDILAEKKSRQAINSTESATMKKILNRPLERRRTDPAWKKIEEEYLARHPDKRGQNIN